MLKWPDAPTVDQAARQWAQQTAAQTPGVRRIGYFGSYATGNWGVGSDLDLIVIAAATDTPFERRATQFDTTQLPVPAEVLVYTEAEWQAILERDDRFARTVRTETVWLTSGFAANHPCPHPIR